MLAYIKELGFFFFLRMAVEVSSSCEKDVSSRVVAKLC